MNGTARLPFVLTTLSILALSAAAASAQPASCAPCDALQERCSSSCLTLADHAASQACLVGCDNAAATCTLCDGPVTLRSEDVVPAATALTAEACHEPTTCGSEYTSCANWSAYYDCGEIFCVNHTKGCGQNCEPGFPCLGPARYQPIQSYRVCFNSQGQSCIQYSTPTSRRLLGCGC